MTVHVHASAPKKAGQRRLSGLPSLTGLRFLAATAVFLYHVTGPQLTPFGGETAQRGARFFGVAGGLGVAFFFVLSGFILTWSARPGDGAGRFLRRRLVKLFPNHLVTFGVALLAFAAATTTSWQQWLPNLLLVQTWSWDPAISFGVNAPSWSLGCELVFYLCFPLLHRAVRKIDATRLWGWVLALVAAVWAVPAFAYAVLPGEIGIPGWQASTVQNWFVYQLPPVRMLEFVLGMLLARIVLTDRWIGVRLPTAIALCAVAYAVALQIPYLYALTAVWVVPIGLLVPAAAVADLRGSRSPFRGRTMTWLGEISFAFYLLQASVLVGGSRYLVGHKPFGWAAGLGLCVLAWALTLALATVLYRCVERPAMKHWSRPRAAAGPVSVTDRPASPVQ
ncbi:acyltransferase [Streptomyces luteolifulvus]|uniref:Acyltransferase n=1 Tax=Streptomyces luteolifulvus TaxID=2615112 RepID=A0A6H9V168_9ACTN|nr:acyltransferase [Streptomyces luteolifulvus]KAB1147634.1 acyltransferase [Streptomyces luteolifulvus]